MRISAAVSALTAHSTFQTKTLGRNHSGISTLNLLPWGVFDSAPSQFPMLEPSALYPRYPTVGIAGGAERIV